MAKALEIGKALPSSGNLYLRVKEKGDQIQFRIGQHPVYEAKHFMQKEQGWDVTECARIMNDDDCHFCTEFFKLKAKAKRIKDVDEKTFKELDNQARKFAPSTQFFFPVLNRDSKTFGILQTTAGVKTTLDEMMASGVKVFERDFVLRNTGAVGKGRYSLVVVDSADTEEFDDTEKKEYEKAAIYDMSQVGESTSSEEDEE